MRSFGWREASSTRSGATCRRPNESGTAMRRSPITSSPRCATAPHASSRSARIRSALRLNSAPASVGLMPCVVRLRSRPPRLASSLAKRRLTIDLDSPSRLAARLRLPASTISTKARMSSSSDNPAFLRGQQRSAQDSHSSTPCEPPTANSRQTRTESYGSEYRSELQVLSARFATECQPQSLRRQNMLASLIPYQRAVSRDASTWYKGSLVTFLAEGYRRELCPIGSYHET